MEKTEKILTGLRDDVLSLIDLFRRFTKDVMADPNYKWDTQTPFWSKVIGIYSKLSYTQYDEFKIFNWLSYRDYKEFIEWLEYQKSYLKVVYKSQFENLKFCSKFLMNDYSIPEQISDYDKKWCEFKFRYAYLIQIEKDLSFLIKEVQDMFILPDDFKYNMELNKDMFNFPVQHANYTINFREMYDNQIQILNIYCYQDLDIYRSANGGYHSKLGMKALNEEIIIPFPWEDTHSYQVGEKHYYLPCLLSYDEFTELMKIFQNAGEWLNKNIGINEPDNGEYIWSV